MRVDNLINEKINLMSDVDFASDISVNKTVEDVIYDFSDDICKELNIEDKIELMDKDSIYKDVLLYADNISQISLTRDVYKSLKGMDKDFLIKKGISEDTVSVLTDNNDNRNFNNIMAQESLPVALLYGGLKDKEEYIFAIDSFATDEIIDMMFDEVGNLDDINKSVVDYVGSEKVQKHKTLNENIKEKESLIKDINKNGMDLFKLARLNEIDKSIKDMSDER